MKSITVSVDEETYRLSRIKAAEAGTSVSALVRSLLLELVQGGPAESRFDRLHRRQQQLLDAIDAKGPITTPTERLTRDELHDRDALR
jgi:plasmid stability protein